MACRSQGVRHLPPPCGTQKETFATANPFGAIAPRRRQRRTPVPRENSTTPCPTCSSSSAGDAPSSDRKYRPRPPTSGRKSKLPQGRLIYPPTSRRRSPSSSVQSLFWWGPTRGPRIAAMSTEATRARLGETGPRATSQVFINTGVIYSCKIWQFCYFRLLPQCSIYGERSFPRIFVICVIANLLGNGLVVRGSSPFTPVPVDSYVVQCVAHRAAVPKVLGRTPAGGLFDFSLE